MLLPSRPARARSDEPGAARARKRGVDDVLGLRHPEDEQPREDGQRVRAALERADRGKAESAGDRVVGDLSPRGADHSGPVARGAQVVGEARDEGGRGHGERERRHAFHSTAASSRTGPLHAVGTPASHAFETTERARDAAAPGIPPRDPRRVQGERWERARRI